MVHRITPQHPQTPMDINHNHRPVHRISAQSTHPPAVCTTQSLLPSWTTDAGVSHPGRPSGSPHSLLPTVIDSLGATSCSRPTAVCLPSRCTDGVCGPKHDPSSTRLHATARGCRLPISDSLGNANARQWTPEFRIHHRIDVGLLPAFRQWSRPGPPISPTPMHSQVPGASWQSTMPSSKTSSRPALTSRVSQSSAAASGSGSGAKTSRQQFTACGACRHRRVKCDLKDRQESAEQTVVDEEGGIGPHRISAAGRRKKVICTNCQDRGTNCV